MILSDAAHERLSDDIRRAYEQEIQDARLRGRIEAFEQTLAWLRRTVLLRMLALGQDECGEVVTCGFVVMRCLMKQLRRAGTVEVGRRAAARCGSEAPLHGASQKKWVLSQGLVLCIVRRNCKGAAWQKS
ncbi:hypothetical protein [Microbacterium aurantiacum]|uniref:Uncharacterized protein n=1 Tax=Microbacterium aurantiacum TaxID=162393 RepID=A0A0M8MJ94_9MICO|nr:hypothetical protein [Microbacterium chocolatum]ANG85485.1 hypothetical protein A8L33_08885 [Microbacterium chocolatum]KOS11227.1 hypothetical protein XI38_04980 [Microbacterium chocolatum]